MTVSVASNSATLGGSVFSDGGATITERGVVFARTAINANPLIGGTGVTKVPVAGTTGSFSTVNLSGAYGTLSGIIPGPAGWSATLGGTLFTFTNATGDLVLSLSAVPEPLTAAGVMLLAGRVLGRRSRVSM